MSGKFYSVVLGSVSKFRVVIPSIFKSEFGKDAHGKYNVFCTLSPTGKEIYIFPLDTWELTYEKLKEGTKREKDLLDYFIRKASKQIMEDNGRLRLSDRLLSATGITDNVILQGEGSFISIWIPENHQIYDEKQNQELPTDFKASEIRI